MQHNTKAFEYGNAFDTIGKRNVCSCVLTFNFVSMQLGGATMEC